MPLYDFRCKAGHKFERMVKLADFEEIQHCSCLAPATRLISAPMISVENVGYTCPITDKWIGSKREHQRNLQEHDCRVFEPGEKESAARFRKSADESLERSVDDSVEQAVEALPSGQRERLYNELVASDVEVVRG